LLFLLLMAVEGFPFYPPSSASPSYGEVAFVNSAEALDRLHRHIKGVFFPLVMMALLIADHSGILLLFLFLFRAQILQPLLVGPSSSSILPFLQLLSI